MNQMLNDLEFEQKIKDFSPAERFLAREIYEIKKQCAMCNQPDRKQRVFNITGLVGFVVAVIVGLIEYFKKSN